MDDWRIESVAVRAGIEDTVSGVGEAVDEGVGEVDVITFYLEISFKWCFNKSSDTFAKQLL